MCVFQHQPLRLLLSPATAGAKVKKQLYAWLVCQFSKSSLGHCSSCLACWDEDLTLSFSLIVCAACCAGLSPVISAQRAKITKLWKAKCALSLSWKIWKALNALFLGRLKWSPVSSHSGEGLKTLIMKNSFSSAQCRTEKKLYSGLPELH